MEVLKHPSCLEKKNTKQNKSHPSDTIISFSSNKEEKKAAMLGSSSTPLPLVTSPPLSCLRLRIYEAAKPEESSRGKNWGENDPASRQGEACQEASWTGHGLTRSSPHPGMEIHRGADVISPGSSSIASGPCPYPLLGSAASRMIPG